MSISNEGILSTYLGLVLGWQILDVRLGHESLHFSGSKFLTCEYKRISVYNIVIFSLTHYSVNSLLALHKKKYYFHHNVTYMKCLVLLETNG